MLEFLFTEREDAGKARPKPKPVIQPKPPTSPGSKEGGGEVDRSSSGRAAGGKKRAPIKKEGGKKGTPRNAPLSSRGGASGSTGQEYGPAVSRRPGASQAFTMQATVGSTPRSTSKGSTSPQPALFEDDDDAPTSAAAIDDSDTSSLVEAGGGGLLAPGEDGMGAIRFSKGEEARPLEEMDTVPSTWKATHSQDAAHRKSVKGPAPEIGNVNVKGKKGKAKKGLLGALAGKSKKEAAVKPSFEARAALAYYGTIGGGFGTPRVGVALGQFNVPAWMTCRPSGELVVSSTFANEVQLLSTRGGPAAVINHGANDKLLYNPQGLAVSADGGSLFVSDGGNNCVQKFTLSPTHGVSPVGCTSTEELHRPQGIAIEDNALFVASSGKGQIVVLDGNSLRLLFRFGSGQLLRPSDVAIYRPPHRGGPRGPVSLLYICDMGNERIAIYSTNGDALGSIGSRGDAPGQFREPLGITVRDQRIFVAEGIGARLQVLEPDGTPLLVLPAPTGGRLVGVAWHESRLYVSEIEAHRIHVFKIID